MPILLLVSYESETAKWIAQICLKIVAHAVCLIMKLIKGTKEYYVKNEKYKQVLHLYYLPLR